MAGSKPVRVVRRARLRGWRRRASPTTMRPHPLNHTPPSTPYGRHHWGVGVGGETWARSSETRASSRGKLLNSTVDTVWSPTSHGNLFKSCLSLDIPYTLHPTPYTLHPAPYTLHRTPYTLHPTPYTLQATCSSRVACEVSWLVAPSTESSYSQSTESSYAVN